MLEFLYLCRSIYSFMLTLKTINENPENVIRLLSKKHFDGNEIIRQIIDLDDRRRKTQTQLDALLGEVNTISKSIGQLMKEGNKKEADGAREKVLLLKGTSGELVVKSWFPLWRLPALTEWCAPFAVSPARRRQK